MHIYGLLECFTTVFYCFQEEREESDSCSVHKTDCFSVSSVYAGILKKFSYHRRNASVAG